MRQGVVDALEAAADSGIDQSIVMPGDAYVVVWVDSTLPLQADTPDWGYFGPRVRQIASMDAQRIICRGEPPTVTLNQTSALNFIFLRNPGMFLF